MTNEMCQKNEGTPQDLPNKPEDYLSGEVLEGIKRQTENIKKNTLIAEGRISEIEHTLDTEGLTDATTIEYWHRFFDLDDEVEERKTHQLSNDYYYGGAIYRRYIDDILKKSGLLNADQLELVKLARPKDVYYDSTDTLHKEKRDQMLSAIQKLKDSLGEEGYRKVETLNIIAFRMFRIFYASNFTELLSFDEMQEILTKVMTGGTNMLQDDLNREAERLVANAVYDKFIEKLKANPRGQEILDFVATYRSGRSYDPLRARTHDLEHKVFARVEEFIEAHPEVNIPGFEQVRPDDPIKDMKWPRISGHLGHGYLKLVPMSETELLGAINDLSKRYKEKDKKI